MTVRGIHGSGGGGGGGGSSHTPVESPNDLRSKATTRGIGILSEGEIVGLVNGARSIYFDNTPLRADDGSYNFEGVSWWERRGTPDQDHIPGFPSVESETEVGATVTHDNPVTRTIVNPDVDAVRVKVRLPQGLLKQHNNGDLKGWDVAVAFDVRAAGGNWQEAVSDVIKGKTTTPYERAYRIELRGDAPWDIRMRRVSEDSEDAKIRDSVVFGALTEIIDAKLQYPDTAVMGLAVDAEKFGNAIPNISFEIKGLKVRVPTSYNPDTRHYAGLWNGSFKLAWTDNPAWCVYDMMRNDRYGLGCLELDKWAMYEIARYCDELVPDGFGGTEPRFTLNCVLQTREDAYHVINTLIAACRGLCYWGSGTVTFVQDCPQEPTHIAAPADVENGDFSYQGTGVKSRHTAALVTWNDPEDGYRPTVEVVEHPEGLTRFGWQPTDVVAFGCTSRGQAHRLGKWILDTEQNETETVTFVAGLEYADALPGSLCQVADPAVAGIRMAGRVKQATARRLVVDAPITIEPGEGYILTVVLPDKTTADVDITNAPGETDTLTLATALPQVPITGAMWVVTATNVAPRLFRVLSNVETEPHKYQITALEHDPNKFDRVELGLSFDPAPISVLAPKAPAPVTGLDVTEYLCLVGETNIEPAVLLSWDLLHDEFCAAYEVEYRKTLSGEWQSAGATTGTSLAVEPVTTGVHQWRVRALNALGLPGPWCSPYYIDIQGKKLPPPDVTGFKAAFTDGKIQLSWEQVDVLDLSHYEVRDASGKVVFSGKATSCLVPPLVAGEYSWTVRTVDILGNLSVNAVGTQMTVTGPEQPSLFASIVGPNIQLTWEPSASCFPLKGCEVFHGSSLASAERMDGGLITTSLQFPGTAGEHRFWVRYTDVAGNVGEAGSVDIVISPPGKVDVIAQVIDNNVLLSWTQSAGTLPVEEFEIRKGADYAAAEVVGRISSLFTAIFESRSGEYTYWVTPIDTARNFGTPAKVVATVDQPPDYVLKDDQASDFGGQKVNALLLDSGLLLPVNATATVAERMQPFGSRQNKVNAGFAYRMEPGPDTATYQEVIDYGTVLATDRAGHDADDGHGDARGDRWHGQSDLSDRGQRRERGRAVAGLRAGLGQVFKRLSVGAGDHHSDIGRRA